MTPPPHTEKTKGTVERKAQKERENKRKRGKKTVNNNFCFF